MKLNSKFRVALEMNFEWSLSREHEQKKRQSVVSSSETVTFGPRIIWTDVELEKERYPMIQRKIDL